MIPFKELQDCADTIKNETGNSCFVGVKYWAFRSDHTELKYTFYINGEHHHFNTVDELLDAMSRIIDPTEDEGVSV